MNIIKVTLLFGLLISVSSNFAHAQDPDNPFYGLNAEHQAAYNDGQAAEAKERIQTVIKTWLMQELAYLDTEINVELDSDPLDCLKYNYGDQCGLFQFAGNLSFPDTLQSNPIHIKGWLYGAGSYWHERTQIAGHFHPPYENTFRYTTAEIEQFRVIFDTFQYPLPIAQEVAESNFYIDFPMWGRTNIETVRRLVLEVTPTLGNSQWSNIPNASRTLVVLDPNNRQALTIGNKLIPSLHNHNCARHYRGTLDFVWVDRNTLSQYLDTGNLITVETSELKAKGMVPDFFDLKSIDYTQRKGMCDGSEGKIAEQRLLKLQ